MNISAIVFSKNRPLQLFACLESMLTKSNISPDQVSVIYKADHDFIIPYYEVQGEIISRFGNVNFVPEFDFRQQTLDLISRAKDYVVFFTDDDVFKDTVNLEHCLSLLHLNPACFCFSLRLGKHLKYCYSTQSSQDVPSGTTKEPFFVWNWKGTSWDWNYPLSVDGHIFRKNDILTAANGTMWKSPNTFEGAMSHLHPQIPHPQMACFVTSKVFNIPHNRVQNEVQNVSEGGSENDLLTAWQQGKKIDISTFQNINNISAHQNVPLVLKDRK